MITFTKLGQYGRLGNQLFQYAILLVIGETKGYTIKIPDYNNAIWHGQKCLLGNFNISADFLSKNDKIEHNYIEPRHKNFTYLSNVLNIQDNTDLFGFFQNYQYHKNHVELIRKEFSLKKDIIERSYKIFRLLKEQNKGYEIVALHLRRGDTELNMYGIDKLQKNSKWYAYFYEAKKMFRKKKVKFLLFTGGKRGVESYNDDYEWCQMNFKGNEYLFIDGERTTINDFALMQQCDHYIFSPISSFGWWVGFLNTDINKIIIAPRKYWFLEKDLGPGFYPPNFIQL